MPIGTVVKVSRHAAERRPGAREFVLLAFRAPKAAKLNQNSRSRALRYLQHVSFTIWRSVSGGYITVFTLFRLWLLRRRPR